MQRIVPNLDIRFGKQHSIFTKFLRIYISRTLYNETFYSEVGLVYLWDVNNTRKLVFIHNILKFTINQLSYYILVVEPNCSQ